MTDRVCVRCKYNLRGLETGGVCPECGTAITSRKKTIRFADNLVDAPIGYIKLLAVGLGIQALMVVFFAFLIVFRGLGVFAAILMAGSAVGWACAAWIVTAKRPKTEQMAPDEILDSDRIRLIARLSQSIVVFGAGALWGAAYTGSGILAGLYGVLMVAALFGLVPMGIYLSSLADWAGETSVGARLRGSVWLLAVCGTLLVVLTVALQIALPFRLFLVIFATISGVSVLIGLVLFGVSVLQLALAATWAIQNAGQARERDIRMAEKRRRRALRDEARANEAAAAMAAAAPPPPESFADDPSVIPLDDGSGSQLEQKIEAVNSGGSRLPVDSMIERTISPDDDSQMYDLEPEG